MPAPLDIDKFKDITEIKKTKNQIAYVGRDSYEKGIDILKNIEPKINGKVVYCTNLPWRKTMEILKASTLLIVPSRMESIPQVIKEAFYLKIPVIATDVGGVSELIQDRKTGILIPPQNPEKMLDEINNLLIDHKTSQKLIENAFKFIIENLTWSVLLPQYIRLYEN